MKKLVAVCALMIFSLTLASAQSSDQPTKDPNAATTRYDEPRHNNWSWIGLLGLVGLAGLRRQKSETAHRLEARGVKVGSV